MDNKYSVKTPAAIFIDLSKALDNLRFDILVDKLKYYGITGVPLKLNGVISLGKISMSAIKC